MRHLRRRLYVKRQIFPITLDKIERSIPDIVREGDSFTNVKKSIGFEVESGKAESILVGSEGYFE